MIFSSHILLTDAACCKYRKLPKLPKSSQSKKLYTQAQSGADPGAEIGGGYMASAEREPIMGVWGLCP